MGKKRYIVSNFSESEIDFFYAGGIPMADRYALSDIMRIIGKFEEYTRLGIAKNIAVYQPENDRRYQCENVGIALIREFINQNRDICFNTPYCKRRVSKIEIRRMVKKYTFSPVKVSKQADAIARGICLYISRHGYDECKNAIILYSIRHGIEGWFKEYIPLHARFLSVVSDEAISIKNGMKRRESAKRIHHVFSTINVKR